MQVAHKVGGGENERPRSPVYTVGNRSSGPGTHRLRTEAYEHTSMTNTVPPAGEYLRAPVCCSECEYFWKALILEVDAKHTSREPAGKASLVMEKGASRSILQIKSKKHVSKERRFFTKLSCKRSTAREDAALPSGSKSRDPTASRGYSSHEYYPSTSDSSVSRQRQSLHSLSTVGYGAAPKQHDVISTPRRHGQIPHTDTPRSAVFPESIVSSTQTRRSDQYFSRTSPEANQAHHHHVAHPELKPIRTRFDTSRRPVEESSQQSRPPRHAPNLASPYTPFPQLKPFPRATSSLNEKAPSSGARRPREFLSQPSTARMLTPRGSPLPENRVEEILSRNFPPRTPWDTQSFSPGTSPLRHPNAVPSELRGQGKGMRNLSRTSTIESDYTYLSISGSDWSSDSQERDSPSPAPREVLRNSNGGDNLSRTWTGTSSLMEPIVLFTGHGCGSETDEDSEGEDDVVVTNPNYFKHVVKATRCNATTTSCQV